MRVIASVLSGAGLAVLLVSALLAGTLPGPGAPAWAAELYSKETLDRYFRLEWSKNGRNVNGYVYNSGNRRAVNMRLLVEGLDANGHVVAKATTWVRDVPPNNRAYFDVAVPTAPSYRVSVLSFDWIEDGDRFDRLKGFR